jgi:hypothetical protein
MWPLAFGCGKSSGKENVLHGCQTILVENTGKTFEVNRTSGPYFNRRYWPMGVLEMPLQTIKLDMSIQVAPSRE